MAAKTFQEWLDCRPSIMDGDVLVDLQDCWEAATKAVEARFTSTNTARDETVRCGIKLQECYSYCRDHCERDVCEYQERTASPVA